MKGEMSQGGIIIRNGKVHLRVALRLKRRSGRKTIILPGTAEAPGEGGPGNHSLDDALARAHVWAKWMEEGRFRFVSALASEQGVDEAYVRRILGLTSLAPDIIEAVLEGREPDGLSIAKLTKAPLSWEAQRRQFGFGAASTDSERGPAVGKAKEGQRAQRALASPVGTVRD